MVPDQECGEVTSYSAGALLALRCFFFHKRKQFGLVANLEKEIQ